MQAYKREDNAANFLFFSYFGIKTDACAKDVVKAVIKRAYRDAASRVLSISNEPQKKKVRATATKLIEDAIALMPIDSIEKFDNWHEDLLNQLLMLYSKIDCKKGYEFSVGIAQKWINMTLKYLYTIYWFFLICGFEDNDFTEMYGDRIHLASKYFHVPLDSFILKAAKKDFGKDFNKSIRQSWSKINDYGIYLEYQNKIRKAPCFAHDPALANPYSPIDWEGPTWINYAIDPH